MADIKSELDFLHTKLMQNQLPVELQQKAERMLDRMNAAMQASGYSLKEFEIISKYIDWISEIPFGKVSQDTLELAAAKQTLDKNHYGLDGVKERILEFLATKKLKEMQATGANNANVSGTTNIKQDFNTTTIASPVLCFVGVQGIGKTTMAKAIAGALGRRFERIALGAFASVYEIRGLSKAESGAEPGQIIKALIRAGSMNPVILLDEVDKVSDAGGLKADIMAALLEILDPAQNRQFTDRYIDYPIDLSRIIFIATANNISGVSAALLDRLELIRFSSYTDEEKAQIAKNYLLPKIRKEYGIDDKKLQFSEDVWPLVIRPFGMDPGIRQLERNLKQLARKVAKLIVEGHQGQIVITPQNFREFMPEKIEVYA